MLRTAHGSAAKSGRTIVVETSPADELPAGLPAPARPAADRDAAGRLVQGPGTREQARRAALAKHGRLRALERLGLPAGSGGELAPYLRHAEEWATLEIQRLAAHVGGGVCPPNVAALVHSAALAMAGSRAAYARGDATAGARLGAEQRANTLAAHELAAREAKAREAAANAADSEEW